MRNRDDPRLVRVGELVMRSLDALKDPTVGSQLPDDLRALHGGYYTHCPAVLVLGLHEDLRTHR